MASSKKKNNHFVPRSYLRRFCSASVRQIDLYNFKNDRIVESAPIKSQCSRDYFYSKDPKYEDLFGAVEGEQQQLLDGILSSEKMPKERSQERFLLYYGILFQAGRTKSTVASLDHMSEQLGKAVLKHHLQLDGNQELLDALPHVKIETTTEALIGSIGQNLTALPLIEDLQCSLLLNGTAEDFITSDHPVALCDGLPERRGQKRRVGLASRGLIILYPISPRAIVMLCDAEAYKVDRNAAGSCLLRRPKDVVELNLAQCASAYENLYFPSPQRVQATLVALRKRGESVRPARPKVKEERIHRGVLFEMPREIRRFPLPQVMHLRHAITTGKYKFGDDFVRDIGRAAQARAAHKSNPSN